jgi:hypothetical protein
MGDRMECHCSGVIRGISKFSKKIKNSKKKYKKLQKKLKF